MDDRLYSIGQVSRSSGVSVQTIRFYSDQGLLPPSKIADSGYRFYSDEDRVKLELIRTLRSLEFDLPTIAKLLQEEHSLSEVIELHLKALESQLHTLTRQRTVLKAIQKTGTNNLAYLERLQTLTKLSKLEREAFLSEHLQRGFEGVNVDPVWNVWKSEFWKAAAGDLPEDMNEKQLAAWLELSELITDESFLAWMRETGRAFWKRETKFDMKAWQKTNNELIAEATKAIKENREPTGKREQKVIAKMIALNAKVQGKKPTKKFVLALLEHYERHDPRAERFWELVGIIKDWPPSPIAKATQWLTEGLRQKVHGVGGKI
jgi:DNA-binding transcriptional MerR regulator